MGLDGKPFSSAFNKLANAKNAAEKAAAPTPRPAAFAAKPASPAPAAAAPAPAPQLKSIDEIAKEVIRGNYGNGEERKRRLAAAGYNYEQVQKRVNEMLRK